MTDIAVRADRYGRYDAALNRGDLVPDNTLRAAVLVCLFTDREATPEQLAAYGMDPSDTRGWWGDALNDDPNDRWGSHLWLLERQMVTPALVPSAKTFAEDALAILVKIGAASAVVASPFIDDEENLILPIAITKPDGSVENYRFANLWAEADVDPFEGIA
ncbi:MAG TPA: phage GP46 family protein [Nevskia sp.]|nr:phage GP46 family protein [Nevskia sp.]